VRFLTFIALLAMVCGGTALSLAYQSFLVEQPTLLLVNLMSAAIGFSTAGYCWSRRRVYDA
jgi:predicted lysophospholipase L1 biosynthesis ABC-type transport system permease subunit